ncbi:MAG: glycerate kinase type-2 family protein [Thiotrichales bacterium]
MLDQLRQDLLRIYGAGVSRVQGEVAVKAALTESPCEGSIDVLAIGKAADAMAAGALERCEAQIIRGLVVTKRDHFTSSFDQRFQLLESDHPVPTQASLAAGAAVIYFLQKVPADRGLLILLSGGASSLIEKLKPGITLNDLMRVNRTLLSAGLEIGQMNAIRSQLSELKGGQSLRFIKTPQVRALLISDVPGDDPAVIGSGPFYYSGKKPEPSWPPELTDIRKKLVIGSDQSGAELPQIPHEIVANPSLAAQAAAAAAEALGYRSHCQKGLLEGSVESVAAQLFKELDQAPAGCYVWNAEPTVTLPPSPGRGGRNQHLALLFAQLIAGRDDLLILVAGTDGTDGPTEDAGAVVDGQSIARGELEGQLAADAVAQFAAGDFLEASGDLITTGPTGTNVMDLIIAIKK